jgi:hypothetical protein
VQIRLLLSGEARVLEVLRGGRRAHRDGRPAELGARRQQVTAQVIGDLGAREQRADVRARPIGGLGVLGVEAADGLEQPLPDARGLDEPSVGVGGEHEARRHGDARLRQLAEVRGLAAHLRDVLS